MGRHRKPAVVRRAEGNRSRRPIPKEIEPRGRLVVPAHLSEPERACWQAVTRALPPDVLTAADLQVLERMSVAWSTFRQAAQIIRSSSLLVKGHDDRPTKNPAFSIMRQAAGEMQLAGAALGLSPAARAALATGDAAAEDGDPLAVLMRGWESGDMLERPN